MKASEKKALQKQIEEFNNVDRVDFDEVKYMVDALVKHVSDMEQRIPGKSRAEKIVRLERIQRHLLFVVVILVLGDLIHFGMLFL